MASFAGACVGIIGRGEACISVHGGGCSGFCHANNATASCGIGANAGARGSTGIGVTKHGVVALDVFRNGVNRQGLWL